MESRRTGNEGKAAVGTERWLEFWDSEGSAAYITTRQFNTVALQFPDELLKEASDVSRALQERCAAKDAQVKVTENKHMWSTVVPLYYMCLIEYQ